MSGGDFLRNSDGAGAGVNLRRLEPTKRGVGMQCSPMGSSWGRPFACVRKIKMGRRWVSHRCNGQKGGGSGTPPHRGDEGGPVMWWRWWGPGGWQQNRSSGCGWSEQGSRGKADGWAALWFNSIQMISNEFKSKSNSIKLDLIQTGLSQAQKF
jgi:hypothetical protein